MTPTQLWLEFLAINPQAGSEPDPWAFGRKLIDWPIWWPRA